MPHSDVEIGTLLVASTMHLTLSMLFSPSDTTSVDENKNRLVGFAEALMREPSQSPNETDELVTWLVDHIEQLPDKKAKSYEQQVYFCESVVQERLNENFSNKQEK